MLDILSNLTKAAVGIATSPVAMVADVVTLGGSLTDKPSTYTGKHLSTILKNIEKVVESK